MSHLRFIFGVSPHAVTESAVMFDPKTLISYSPKT